MVIILCMYILGLSGYMFFLINYNLHRGIRPCLKKKKLHLHNAVQFQSHISLASLRSVLIPLKISSVKCAVFTQPNEKF